MARRFTRRKNGQMMTTFRIRIDLSQDQIDDLVGRSGKIYSRRHSIEEILEGRLMSGIECWTLDRQLDPGREDED